MSMGLQENFVRVCKVKVYEIIVIEGSPTSI